MPDKVDNRRATPDSYIRLRIRIHTASSLGKDLLKYSDGTQERLLSLAHMGLALEQLNNLGMATSTSSSPSQMPPSETPSTEVAKTVSTGSLSGQNHEEDRPPVDPPFLAGLGLDLASVGSFKG